MNVMHLKGLRRLLILGAVCLALALAGYGLIGGLDALLDLKRLARAAMQDTPTWIAVFALYMVLLACPFVPGAELGLLLLLVLGVEAAGPVYLATVAALVLAFLAGRLLPDRALATLSLRLDLPHALETAPVQPGGCRRAEPAQHVALRWARTLLRYRCCALIVLINTPGNTLIGGGGGIAMAAGSSRLISVGEFVTSAALAVAPVPLGLMVADWLA